MRVFEVGAEKDGLAEASPPLGLVWIGSFA